MISIYLALYGIKIIMTISFLELNAHKNGIHDMNISLFFCKSINFAYQFSSIFAYFYLTRLYIK